MADDKQLGRGAIGSSRHRHVCTLGLGVAIAIGFASILIPSSWAQAQTRQQLSIAVDYHRDCGDLKRRKTHRLEKSDDRADLKVRSRSYWNASGLILEKDVAYLIKPRDKEATWMDGGIEAGITGWTPRRRWLRWFMTVMGPLVRSPNEKLFQLMGLIYHKCGDASRSCVTQFAIGKQGRTIKPKTDGEFCAYANDLPFMYGNNSGEIILRITRE